MSPVKKKIVVIGSGFGGLAAAIRLQSEPGFQVTLLEKRNQLGGRASVYREKGFVFDAGPTVITAPHCLEELFEGAGKKMSDFVSLLPVEPFYELKWEDGETFSYGGDLSATLSQIRERSPQDEKGYLQFLEYSKKVFEAGYSQLVHQPFLNFWSMVRVSPQLLQLQAYRSVFSKVSHFIKDPRLQQVFSFHSLLVGGNPFSASSIYTLIHALEKKWGVFFPRGGTGELVQALGKLFVEQGGTLCLNTGVDEILVKDKKVQGVRTLNEEVLPAEGVVSNADVMHTYGHLLRGSSLFERRRRKLSKMHYSMSLFLIYFGTRRTYPSMAHHSVLLGPRYRELLNEIFSPQEKLPEDFSLYLHAPTRTDPSLAPPGCECFYVLSPVPHRGHLSVDWKKEGPRYADRILSYLEKHYLPDLRKELVVQKIFTPEDFENEFSSHLGSAFSLEPRLTQSAFFRVLNRDPQVRGLYFVGAGTHPGAGVPGVVNSARATVSVMLKDFHS